jgi:hypothetical protein
MPEILDQIDQEEQLDRYYRLFVGRRSNYYLRQWRRLRHGQWLTFNSSSFLFGILWLLYRRMFRTAFLFLAVFLAEGFVEALFFRAWNIVPPLWWVGTRTLIFALLLGVLGNWLYLLHTREKVRQITRFYEPGEREEIMRLLGGTSWWPVVLFLLIIALTVFGLPSLGLVLGR